jgi:hypothetical protein
MIQALGWLNMRVKRVGADGSFAQGCVIEGWKRTKPYSGGPRLVAPEKGEPSVVVRMVSTSER